jgi:hypothetical protein
VYAGFGGRLLGLVLVVDVGIGNWFEVIGMRF